MPKANHCPVCDSDTVDFMRIEFDNKEHDQITAHGYCHSCKSHFVEWHKTEYIGSVREEYDPYTGPAGAPVAYGTLEDRTNIYADCHMSCEQVKELAERLYAANLHERDHKCK